jgi:hypothetical protein
MANTWYISTTGNDSTGNGSVGNPWFSPDGADSNASVADGDTIICANGTYVFTANQTIVKNLTIQALNRNLAIFDFSDTYNTTHGNNSLITWDGIIFTNISALTAFSFSITSTVSVVNFKNCIFHDIVNPSVNYSAGTGIFGTGSTTTSGTDLNFEGCLFYNLRRGSTYAVMFAKIGDFSDLTAHTTSMINCTFYFSGTGDTAWTHWGGRTYHAWEMKNCIFVDAGANNFTLYQSTGAWDADYNCFYNKTAFSAGVHDITSDPLFIDAANDDFRLRPTSPCIDIGTII